MQQTRTSPDGCVNIVCQRRRCIDKHISELGINVSLIAENNLIEARSPDPHAVSTKNVYPELRFLAFFDGEPIRQSGSFTPGVRHNDVSRAKRLVGEVESRCYMKTSRRYDRR